MKSALSRGLLVGFIVFGFDFVCFVGSLLEAFAVMRYFGGACGDGLWGWLLFVFVFA